MRRAIRSVATILAILAATAAGVGVAARAQVWAAGERDVTIAQGIDAEFLDVQMTNNIVTMIINGAIYDTLLTRDAIGDRAIVQLTCGRMVERPCSAPFHRR